MTDSESTPKRRRWWLIILGAALILIVVLVGGVFAVGSRLDKQIMSSVSVTFDHPVETVWEGIADYERNPVSGAMRRETISLPDEETGPVWKEDISNSVITVRTLVSYEPDRLVRLFEDSVVPMTSRVEYLLEAEGERTRVTMESITTVQDGTWHVPIFRVILHLMPDAGSLTYLTDLRTHLNADVSVNKEESSNDVS